MVKLFVVGFPREMIESELAQIFGRFGEVEKALIITDKETGSSQGYGFVDMANETSAATAVSGLDGSAIGERILNVRIRLDKELPKKVFLTTQMQNAGHNNEHFPLSMKLPKKKKRPRL